jgi:uncharacterized delta-60 repeat protein
VSGLFRRSCAGAILYVTLVAAVLAATGDWDYSYGTYGRLALTIPQGPFTVRTWRPQADGKLVVAGTIGGMGAETRLIARFHDNGALDSSFDGDGVLVLPWASSFIAGNEIGLELQPDGKMLVWTSRVVFGGNAYHSTYYMRRLNSDGSLDASFANGGEFVFPFDDYTYRGDIGLTAQGGIVLIGHPSTSTGITSGRITRLTSSGAFDTTFGTNGTVQIDAPEVFGVESFAVHPDGSLTVGGAVGYYPNHAPYVAHVTADGRLDPNFGESGILMLPFLNGAAGVADVIAAPDGKVYVAGVRQDLAGTDRGYVARVGTNGQLDPTFGSGGRVITNGAPITLTLESDGKVLVAGYSYELSGLAWAARYNVDGSPDVTFGLRGRSRLDLAHATAPAAEVLRDVFRYPDGSYRALAGYGAVSSMVRLLASGPSAGVIGFTTTNASPMMSELQPFARIQLLRTGGTDGTVSVQYRAVGDTATAGDDFVADTGTVTFNDGEAGPKQVSIQMIDDDVNESDETFHVELFGATGGVQLANGRFDFTIQAQRENDTDVGFVTSNVTVTENAGSARLIVRRTASIVHPLTVTYTANGYGSAVAGVDFTGATGTITWGANEGGERVIELPVIDDASAESYESFTVTLASSTSDAIASYPGYQANVGIADDDALGGGAQFATTVQIVSEAATSVSLTVQRLGDPANAATVDWSTQSSPPVDGQDYVSGSGTLSWSAGDAAPKTIVISLPNDSVVEGLESFTVRLTGNGSLYVASPEAQVYIVDDEIMPAPPVISLAAGTSVNEGAGTATVTVTMTGVPRSTVTINLNRALGTAGADDIGIAGGILTWAAGDTSSRTINVAIVSDSLDEPDEQFSFSLSNATGGASIGTAVARYTIIDDDPTPPGQPAPVSAGVRLPVRALTVREDQQTATFQVERIGNINTSFITQYYVVSGDATSPDDYYGVSGLMVWTNGDTAAREIEIQLNGDTVPEPTETFTVRFIISATVSDEITITVLDDDGPLSAPARVGFSSAAQTVVESATSVTLSVGRTGNSTIPSSVDYTTTSGTAGTTDFVASTGTLTWAANDTSTKLITIALTPDVADESDETFTVTLRNPSAGTEFDTPAATVTISDDDMDVVAPSSGGGGGGGGGEESLLALLLWGVLASVRAAQARSRTRARYSACSGNS